MTFLIKALQLIASLALLVFIHELGHFMWARFFKVRVEKFYLFFDIGLQKLGIKWDGSIFKFKPKKSDTEYGVGWLPLGGYCKISGMIDESMDTEQMKQPEQPWEFRSKPSWQRLLIMIGGVLNNFLLAIIIYAGMVGYWGEKILPFKNAEQGMHFSEVAQEIGFNEGDVPLTADGKELSGFGLLADEADVMLNAKQVTMLRNGSDTVTITIPADFKQKVENSGGSFINYSTPVIIEKTMPGDGAEKAGLKKGDLLLSVNGVSTKCQPIFQEQLQLHKGEQVMIAYSRDGKLDSTKVAVSDVGTMGIHMSSPFDIYKTEYKPYGFFEAIPRGIKIGCAKMAEYVSGFKNVFSKRGAQSLGGFGAIGDLFPDVWNWEKFWDLTALLSVILAFMNILPIPALDGGHVLFLLYEMIFRRKPSDKFMERAQMVGMVILIGLLLWANGNDIYRWIIKPLL